MADCEAFDDNWRARACISPSAFLNNIQRASQLAPHSLLMAVVKADAYGHGVEKLKSSYRHCDYLAVIDVAEAQRLRDCEVKVPLLILQGVNNAEQLHWCAHNQAIPVVVNPTQLLLLQSELAAGLPLARVWIKCDTGMHRLGLSPEQTVDALSRLASEHTELSLGLISHFACADDDADFTRLQIDCYENVLQQLPQGLQVETSLANSAAVFDYVEAHRDVIRPGIMLYGGSPFADRSAADLGLLPVMSLQAKVAAVHRLQAGEAVGYGLTWQPKSECQVAVVSAGYGDGVPRNLPAGVPVVVSAQQGSTVARVSMDSCFVVFDTDATVAVGDIATLWGQAPCGTLLPVDQVAQACDTISYELTCRVTPRVPRVVLEQFADG